MRKIFKFPKLSLRDVCMISMLIAITAILAIYCTFRIGNQIKIPLKFVSVFIASVFFGPWIGGFCGAVGDLLNALLVPVGAFLPQLTVLEFLAGFVFGALFYRQKTKGAGYIIRCGICALIQFSIDMLLTTAVLIYAGYFPGFSVAFIIRLPAGIIKAMLQFAVLWAGCGYLKVLQKFRRI